MKTLYLDCGMGAAGDMLTAALIELLPDADGFVEKMNGLGIPGVKIEREKSVKCGITGTHISVKVHGAEECEGGHGHSHVHDGHEHHHEDGHNHEHEHSHHHHHSSMHEIEHIIMDLNLPQNVRKDIIAVYSLIAEAESRAHGVPVTDIHFHEVGTMDAIADVTAVCMLMNEIAPDEVIVSPVHVGSGTVKCAHGTLPVPAPATAFILKDVPIYGGSIKGELCTPTGAALLKHFATAFADMPVMKTKAIGYGMGKKDFETANCVRAMLGETGDKTDIVLELSCNVDDMTAEEIGFAMERLFERGAREVYTIPIGMKKSRPGTLIRVICLEEDRDKMLALLFKHTTTIGIRETVTKRYVLDRRLETINTPYGEVRRKVSSGYGVTRAKYEYDDLQRIAKERDMSLDEVREYLSGTKGEK
ncbi:MAG: nickel pincer cofactor biosynthesis protein LarC [Lachnospiraceae bacterium]|nr:nickel pincer cofactor biosynthesis protein LarC [Lachnospiraceae bacterium]